ncbi:hypothetical protein K449DRAFT_400194 [Hypoxylon sp. EC38]|nr:hypothetical protein K449DRAFT_400194 [Hypoxylon sp. EC38]
MATVETETTVVIAVAANETVRGIVIHSHSSGGNSKASNQTNPAATYEKPISSKFDQHASSDHGHYEAPVHVTEVTSRAVNAERPPKNPRKGPSVPPNGQSPRDSDNGSSSGNGSGNGGGGGDGPEVSAPPTMSRPRTMGGGGASIWCAHVTLGRLRSPALLHASIATPTYDAQTVKI